MMGFNLFINMENDIGYQKKDLCMTKNIDVISKLLDEGVNVNNLCICGHTAIHFHTIEGNTDVVKYLLSKGADPKIMNIYKDNNAITCAYYYKRTEIYSLLKDA